MTSPKEQASVPDDLQEKLHRFLINNGINKKQYDTAFGTLLALFTQYAREERLDEVENLESDKHSDYTKEVLANRIAELTTTDTNKESQ